LLRLPTPQETGQSFISAIGGTIEELFATNMAGMPTITTGHLRGSGQLADSVVRSKFANMVLLLGRPGKVNISFKSISLDCGVSAIVRS
jgi:hypothetical protein